MKAHLGLASATVGNVRNWVYFNDSQWPLVVFEAPLRFEPVQLARFFADLDYCFEREEQFAMVLDLSPCSLPCLHVRQELADYFHRRATQAQALLVGEATVVGSEPLMGLVNAINRLARPRHPKKTFASRADALRWTRQQLERAGVTQTGHSLRKSGVGFRPALRSRLRGVS